MKKILFIAIIFFLSPLLSLAQSIIGGIGAQLFIDTSGGFNMPRIMSLVDNSPAAQKLKATDFIMSVNGISCKAMTIEEVVALIRGEAGTTVHIVVADTKQGARPREYDITRVAMQVAGATDPATSFNAWCDNDTKQLRKKGFEVIKTFTSDCGNYFFNFNADAGGYRAHVYTMQEKVNGNELPGYTASARLYDGSNEKGAVTLPGLSPFVAGELIISHADGTITFPHDCVGVISMSVQDPSKKCKAMYIVVYR